MRHIFSNFVINQIALNIRCQLEVDEENSEVCAQTIFNLLAAFGLLKFSDDRTDCLDQGFLIPVADING